MNVQTIPIQKQKEFRQNYVAKGRTRTPGLQRPSKVTFINKESTCTGRNGFPFYEVQLKLKLITSMTRIAAKRSNKLPATRTIKPKCKCNGIGLWSFGFCKGHSSC
ncbi:uncharacterized protein [Drosophila takahashii]|uniref:uncharacterized protein n=1 Tax=Drosophila takahashii TaxID=29030 RepID=UPI00389958F8